MSKKRDIKVREAISRMGKGSPPGQKEECRFIRQNKLTKGQY